MPTASTDPGAPPAPARQDPALEAAIADLAAAGDFYAANYFGHFLNDAQVENARSAIGAMETASSRLYENWQRSRAALPSSTEIGRVVEPAMIRSQLNARWQLVRHGHVASAVTGSDKFNRLVQLNERVRRTTEQATEALPIMRSHTLYARHYERNCFRLYGDDEEQIDRLRDAENVRLALEQNLRAVEGDVELWRAQAQSLTLYAQMLLAVQVRVLTLLLITLTAAGVAATFLR
jgi:hypothetical protein